MHKIVIMDSNPNVKTDIENMGSISAPEMIKKIEKKQLYCDPYEEMELDDMTVKMMHYMSDGCMVYQLQLNEYKKTVRENDSESVDIDRALSRFAELELKKKLELYEELTGRTAFCIVIPRSGDTWSDVSYALMEYDGTSSRLMATDIQSPLNLF